jgi:hypothetical protein
MSALDAFVDRINAFAGPSNQLSLQNAQDRQKIAHAIDSGLSPENLSCDGELPRSEVARRYRHLTAAAKELIELDPSVLIYDYE